MISWIVASHDHKILHQNLLATLPMTSTDELIPIVGAASITQAYLSGQDIATQPIRCFIHHDVQILDLALLRSELIEATQGVGLVGMIGSRTPVVPWWNGDLLGSVQDSRLGTLNYGPGGACVVVDGLLIASRQLLPWDRELPGWHMYDHDVCASVTAQGGTVWCVSNGHRLVRHNSDSPFALEAIDGWHTNVGWFRDKWERDILSLHPTPLGGNAE